MSVESIDQLPKLELVKNGIISYHNSNFENNFNNLTSKKYPNMYSIKFINEGMWIKNISEDNNINYINISKINLDNMNAEEIKILNINNKSNKIIIAEKGEIIDKIFKLQNVSIFNINNDKFEKVEFYNLILNFDKSNIIDSILNFKFIPFYKYKKHVNKFSKKNKNKRKRFGLPLASFRFTL